MLENIRRIKHARIYRYSVLIHYSQYNKNRGSHSPLIAASGILSDTFLVSKISFTLAQLTTPSAGKARTGH